MPRKLKLFGAFPSDAVSYVAQKLTSKQQAQARDNIEAAQSPLVVTLTPIEGDEGHYASTHDVQAICAEFDAGRHVVANLENDNTHVSLPIVGAVNNDGMQIAVFGNTNTVLVEGVLEHAITRAIIIGNGDECFAMVSTITPADYVPSTLPNPNSLTFTGAVEDTYDGSEAKIVDIPAVPSTLPNPNALTFTGAVEDTYDGSESKTIDIPVVPSTLPNPKALTINGLSYDGSSEKNVNIVIPDVAGQISTHNTSTESHNDIRQMIDTLQDQLNTLSESDETTLAQMTEMVTYIENNKDLIDSITTDKVNVSDIVDNLITNVANKPLSAAQGVVLKALIDAIKVPTKVSELTNDKAYLTSYTETDPTVPAWAKSPTKPSYTASEVGALPNTTTIPKTLAELTEDSTHRLVTDTEKSTWNAKSDFSGNYNDLSNKPTIPTVPSALKNPNALTFTGAVTGSYDGSSAKTVNIPTVPNALKNPNTLTIDGTSYDGSKAVAVYTGNGKSVLAYGAKGDGSTDDTAAFQAALAENRVVYVPGGTYKLNDTLVIRANCCLELSQDTVLNFTNTSGNCIEMRSSATLRGNHAIIDVPYAFTGHVIDVTSTHDTASGVTPYSHWTPMWKHGRYIYDICIVKANEYGRHCSTDGNCSGTGIYLSGDGNNEVRFIWGALLHGIRIGGAFARGIHAINFDLSGEEDSAWNHDMRVEAVIHGCEIGVDLTNCNDVHLAVTVQPMTAENDAPYAKWGVYLNDCRYIDMSSSVIWDWNANNSLYTPGGQYTTVAMFGNCCGLVYNDFGYHTNSTRTRDRIYTDTPSNLKKMTIMQEPIDTIFKVIDGIPHFTNGSSDVKLISDTELSYYFQTDIARNFTDVLKTATGTDGSIYNEKGYKKGVYLGTTDGADYTSSFYTTTGFIPCAKGDEVCFDGMSLKTDSAGYARVVMYDSNKAYVRVCNRSGVIDGNNYYCGYRETDTGCVFTITSVAGNNSVAFIRVTFNNDCVGDYPMAAVNEEIKYTVEGFLADGVKVKAENVIGSTILTSPNGKKFMLSVDDDGTISTTPMT